MANSPFVPPPSAEDAALARRRTLLRVTVVTLIASGVIVLALPLRLPLPVRLAAAGTDIIAALVVFVALRQARPPR